MPHLLRYVAAAGLLLLLVGGIVWTTWDRSVEQSVAGSDEAVRSERPVRQPAEGQAEVRSSDDLVDVSAAADPGTPWFRRRTGTGVNFQHESGASPEKPFPAANGSGLAALDYDLDGLCDLYFATGTPFPVDTTREGPINRCYRNLGDWRFQDVTQETGLGHNGYSAGVTFGDFDEDGFPDVYVACYGANRLYRNLGDGTFAPLPVESGVGDERWATSAAMFDCDGDGLLDIYICNYGKWTLETNNWCGDAERNIRQYCSPRSVEAERDTLLHNAGDGTFSDATESAGLAQRQGRAQGIVAADLDGDRAIDFYVGNDLHANSLFLNEGDGRFRDVTESSGVAYDYLGGMQAGMGVDAADANGDGRPELFVTNFESEHNAYYENLSSGFFQDVSQQRGLFTASVPWVGWGTAFADFDLDGWLDVIVTNGHVDDNRPGVPYEAPPLLWQNQGGRFAFLGTGAGDYFRGRYVGRGLAVADLDNDGDQDVVVGHLGGSPALLENLHRSSGSDLPAAIVLRLIGTGSNRDAIGSLVTLRGVEPSQVRQRRAGGSYLSAHDPRLVFAPGQVSEAASVEIVWPDGTRSVIDDLSANGAYTVRQPIGPTTHPEVFSSGRLQ